MPICKQFSNGYANSEKPEQQQQRSTGHTVQCSTHSSLISIPDFVLLYISFHGVYVECSIKVQSWIDIVFGVCVCLFVLELDLTMMLDIRHFVAYHVCCAIVSVFGIELNWLPFDCDSKHCQCVLNDNVCYLQLMSQRTRTHTQPQTMASRGGVFHSLKMKHLVAMRRRKFT